MVVRREAMKWIMTGEVITKLFFIVGLFFESHHETEALQM